MDKKYQNFINYLLEGIRMSDEDVSKQPKPKKGWIDIDNEFEYGHKYNTYQDCYYWYKEKIEVGDKWYTKWEEELKKHGVEFDHYEPTFNDNTNMWFLKNDEKLINFLKFCKQEYDKD